MAKSQETSNKKDNERKKALKRKEKAQKREERKQNSQKGQTLEEMFAYPDGYGNIIVGNPADSPGISVRAEDIQVGVARRPNAPQAAIDRTGVVTYFNDDKGYGFLRDLENQASVFLHINNTPGPVKIGDKLTFRIESGQKGPVAVQVKKA